MDVQPLSFEVAMPPCPGHIVTSKLKGGMSVLVPVCTDHCGHRAQTPGVCSGGRSVEARLRVGAWEGPTMLLGLLGAKKARFVALFCENLSQRCPFF